MRLSPDQRGVVIGGLKGVAVALVLGIPAYGLARAMGQGPPPDMDAGERLAFAVRWDVPLLIWLAACVRRVSSGRFRSPADIGGSAFAQPSAAIAVPRAVLQNSLEQVVLAVGAHLALAVVLRGAELLALPVLVGLFLAGRVWFALGYARGAPGRAPGMVLTAAPTFAALLLAGVLALSGR
ncbi:MAG: MAPEG family protein [Pseudomonadota bacterium]